MCSNDRYWFVIIEANKKTNLFFGIINFYTAGALTDHILSEAGRPLFFFFQFFFFMVLGCLFHRLVPTDVDKTLPSQFLVDQVFHDLQAANKGVVRYPWKPIKTNPMQNPIQTSNNFWTNPIQNPNKSQIFTYKPQISNLNALSLIKENYLSRFCSIS